MYARKTHYKLSEVGSMLTMSPWKVRDLIRKGILKAGNVGTTQKPYYKVHIEDLMELARSRNIAIGNPGCRPPVLVLSAEPAVRAAVGDMEYVGVFSNILALALQAEWPNVPAGVVIDLKPPSGGDRGEVWLEQARYLARAYRDGKKQRPTLAAILPGEEAPADGLWDVTVPRYHDGRVSGSRLVDVVEKSCWR